MRQAVMREQARAHARWSGVRAHRAFGLGVLASLSVLVGCGGSDAAATAAEARQRLLASPGGQRVLEAIEAHGGLEPWYAAPTSAYAWEYSNFGSNTRFESYLVADNRTRRTYHDLRTYGTPEAIEEVDGTFAWDGENAWISPADLEGPNPRFWSLTGYYFVSIPYVMADPGVNLDLLTPEDLDGVPHDRVLAYFDAGVGDSPGDRYTLYIDQETDLVDAVLYTVTFGQSYDQPEQAPDSPLNGTILHYLDHATVDGVTVATRFEGFAYRDGAQGDVRSEAWTREISFREPFDESRLAMPEDARVAPYDVR